MKANDSSWNTIRFILDVSLVCVAWLIAYFLRFHTVFEAPKGIPNFSLYAKLTPFIAIIWILACQVSGLNRRSKRRRSAFLEGLDIVQTSFVAILVFIAFTYFYEEYRYSRITIAFFAFLAPAAVISGRSFLRKRVRKLYRLSPRRVLIVGNAEDMETAERIYGTMPGHQLVGKVALDHSPENPTTDGTEKIYGVPTDWVAFLSHHDIQCVVLAMHGERTTPILDHLRPIIDQVPDVVVIPNLHSLTGFGASLEMVGDTPIIRLHDSPLDTNGRILKRLLDMVGATVGLILLSPLLITLAVLVRLSSPGPIFYRQERMGLDGRTFEILKFRSMPITAEAETGAVWAKAEDNRPTAVGRFLRRTSLDELPQLINVLKGEMSLVGPRPERPVFVHDFRRKIPGYMLRHKVKAGMTGWAQVNGWRGNTSLERRIECDLFYIRNWSILLDIKIIAMTFFTGFINKNAY